MSRTRSPALVLFLLACLCPSVAVSGSIEFKVGMNPAGSFIAGSKDLEGVANIGADGTVSAKDLRLRINTLKSGIGLRDRHMTENYFEISKFPEARISSARGKDGKFEAELNLHGKTRKIEGTYSIVDAVIRGQFTCKISDYGIAEANYKGVGVDNEVDVYFELPALR